MHLVVERLDSSQVGRTRLVNERCLAISDALMRGLDLLKTAILMRCFHPSLLCSGCFAGISSGNERTSHCIESLCIEDGLGSQSELHFLLHIEVLLRRDDLHSSEPLTEVPLLCNTLCDV